MIIYLDSVSPHQATKKTIFFKMMNNHSLQMILLSILLIITFNSSCHQSSNVNAYQTFELIDYCQRFDSNVKFSNNNEKHFDDDNDDDISSGMVIEPPPSSSNVESKSSSTVNDLNNSLKIDSNYASKRVIVDTGYDTSAVRLIVNPENVFRARLRCSILVIPKKPNGLIVTLRKLHVRPGTDWLRISINNSSFTRTFSHIRINSERDSVAYVAHHGVLIEFATRTYLPKEEKVEIELILTSFREADLCDIDEEFDCGSFRCISNHYVCDGYNNCGDSRDETNCPMDNITTYLIVSTTLLLVAFIIFLCICYRCCFRTGKNHHNRQSGAYISPAYRNHHHKQYPYLRIRTNSTPVAPETFTNQQSRIRSQSIQSEADLPDSATNNSSNSAFRRFKLSGDSMPVLVPTAPNAFQPTANNYGSLGQTFFPPSYVSYQPYTITLTTGTNRIGLRPLRQLRRQNSLLNDDIIPEHHTFPLPPQPNYPILHPQLFQPPPTATINSASNHPIKPLSSQSTTTTNNHHDDPPPPPYSPRDPRQ